MHFVGEHRDKPPPTPQKTDKKNVHNQKSTSLTVLSRSTVVQGSFQTDRWSSHWKVFQEKREGGGEGPL